MFTLNFSEVKESNGLVAEGMYEVVCVGVEEKTTQSGRRYLSFDMVIRNDIAQAHQNCHIWHSVWTKKDDNATYIDWQINSLGKAFKLQDGKRYNTLQELIGDFVGKTAKIDVKHEDGNARAKFFMQTGFPQCNHQFKASNVSGMGQSVSVDNNCPF